MLSFETKRLCFMKSLEPNIGKVETGQDQKKLGKRVSERGNRDEKWKDKSFVFYL